MTSLLNDGFRPESGRREDNLAMSKKGLSAFRRLLSRVSSRRFKTLPATHFLL